MELLSSGRELSISDDGRFRVSMKCDRCDNTATVNLTELRDGKPTTYRLCVECVQKDYPNIPKHDVGGMLRQFVLKRRKPDERPPTDLE